jgi:hypothetical protein
MWLLPFIPAASHCAMSDLGMQPGPPGPICKLSHRKGILTGNGDGTFQRKQTQTAKCSPEMGIHLRAILAPVRSEEEPYALVPVL